MNDRFGYGLAEAGEEAQIRALLARNPVPGMIEVAYCRDPDYFLGCHVMGDRVQVVVCRKDDAEVVGIAQRSSRMMFYNGTAMRVGYLSQLRVDRHYQGQGLTREGFRYARHLHAIDEVRGYITTIIELNRRARAVLERPRDPFPHYHDIGRVHTLALLVRPRKMPHLTGAVTLEPAREASEIVGFLNRLGPRRQFFYQFTTDDFDNGRLLDFRLEDLVVARRKGKIAGTLGYWNQSNYKQSVVAGYHPTMSLLKPFYNLYLRKMGGRPMPRLGDRISHSYASLACVEEDERQIFEALLHAVLAIAHDRGDAYVMIGIHQDDPLLPVARSLPHVAYRSRLYAVTWEDKDDAFYRQLDGRIPHVEIATL